MSLLIGLLDAFVKLDEPSLLKIDEEIATALGWNDGRTVSYHLGMLENGTDSFTVTPQAAHKVCDILAQVLGPNHCQNAVFNESSM